jgi:hypothetical protein
VKGIRTLIATLTLSSPLAMAIDPVVIATPVKVKFVMAEADLPQNKSSDSVLVGGVYSTRLLVREVLQGDLSDRTITVDLVATSRENLSKAKSLVVMLRYDSEGNLVAKGWDEIHRVACIPEEFATVDVPTTSAFPLAVSPIGLRCRFLQ